MDNPEKRATQGTQDEEKQNKNTTQYVLHTNVHKQIQITYKQLEVKTNGTSTLIHIDNHLSFLQYTINLCKKNYSLYNLTYFDNFNTIFAGYNCIYDTMYIR